MKLRLKRLKIVEQMIVVILVSVLIPLTVTAFIVNNVNQHGIRKELRYSALMISKVVSQNINTYLGSDTNFLSDINIALKFMKNEEEKRRYLDEITRNSKDFKEVYIEKRHSQLEFYKNNPVHFNPKDQELVVSEKLTNNEYIVAKINIDTFKNKIFSTFKHDSRQIYVLDANSHKIIISHNFSQQEFQKAIDSLPKKLSENKPYIFGKKKNEPVSYYKMKDPDFLIITSTTETVADKTIYTDRAKIIGTIVFAALSVIAIIGLYTYYLYINMRQLFKGILAISKGNYKRKIRFLTNLFTPYEMVFLSFEFNKMVYAINISYRELKQKNIQLKKMDELRSNLMDTVSHELRTPLTSIMGYTSRLLRVDIKIDEETRIKSLKTIKRQSERLARLVEDLLVVPKIENNKIKLELKSINIKEKIEEAMILVKDFKSHNFLIEGDDTLCALADEDRFEQVVINLLENASKYAYDDSDINIKIMKKQGYAVMIIENRADFIEEAKLATLLEKFIRLDDKTTRTTRGTGLGLFIVKGIVEAMNGEVRIFSYPSNVFKVEVKLQMENNYV